MADVVVLGATGYCGRLTALYLSHHPQRSTFTLGIAGRSRSKLEAIKKELDADVKIFVVDVNNYDELEAFVKQVKVVANTVGPYWKYSTPVVRACAKNGVHHCDLNGETPWMYEMIHQYDYLAHQTGALIVPSCGIDSIPSDAIVYLANKTLKSLVGPDAEIENSTTAVKFKGGIAGGTLATIVSGAEDVPRNIRQMARRAYSLSPVVGVPINGIKLIYSMPQISPSSEPVYGGIFVLAQGNCAIVQRTWGLQQYHAVHSPVPSSERVKDKMLTYGPRFKYEEFLITRNKVEAVVRSMGFIIFTTLMLWAPFRWWFKNWVTQPGQGPPEHTLKDGYFEYTNISTSVPSNGGQPTHIRTIIRGNGDPGLLLTATMLGESALALAQDTDRLPKLAKHGGVLTPMAAMGDTIIERMKSTGQFEFESEVVLEGEGNDEGRKTR